MRIHFRGRFPFRKHPRNPARNLLTYRIPLNGITAFVFSVRYQGDLISMSGWWEGFPCKVGDYAVLINCEDRSETRYRFISVRRMTDPPDQYFADLAFAPRT